MKKKEEEKTEKWFRIDKRRLRNVGGNCDHKRVYCNVPRKIWPRLVIGLHINDGKIEIVISKKDSLKHWWEKFSLPIELKDELVEMLQELKV